MKTDQKWLVNSADLRLMATDRGYLSESKLWLAQTLLWLPADAVDGTPPAELLTFAGEGGAGGGDTSGEAINKGTGPAAVGGAGDIVNVLHRGSWEPGVLWLGAVGGTANVSHGHMHAGSFCFDAGLGEDGEAVRWITEVDAHHYDSYRRAGLDLWTWSADLPANRRDRGRDAVYAWGAAGHNTLTVDGRPHHARGVTPLTEYQSRRGNHDGRVRSATGSQRRRPGRRGTPRRADRRDADVRGERCRRDRDRPLGRRGRRGDGHGPDAHGRGRDRRPGRPVDVLDEGRAARCTSRWRRPTGPASRCRTSSSPPAPPGPAWRSGTGRSRASPRWTPSSPPPRAKAAR